MAAVHSSPQGNVKEGERVNVMLIWRWMCKEVLSITDVSTAGLQSARQRLAEDLWSEDGLINGETRKTLGGDESFKSKEDFERADKLRRMNDVDEIIRMLHSVFPFPGKVWKKFGRDLLYGMFDWMYLFCRYKISDGSKNHE